jgi:hypothetical protein
MTPRRDAVKGLSIAMLASRALDAVDRRSVPES